MRLFRAFWTCLILLWMPSLVLICLMIRNDHVFPPSHNSFAEPEGKRWDVRHISLFRCQNNIGMGHTCWRTVTLNSYTQLRMLSQSRSDSEARYVCLAFCLGFWAVNRELCHLWGLRLSWQGWLILHFPVEHKTCRDLLLLQWKNLSHL